MIYIHNKTKALYEKVGSYTAYTRNTKKAVEHVILLDTSSTLENITEEELKNNYSLECEVDSLKHHHFEKFTPNYLVEPFRHLVEMLEYWNITNEMIADKTNLTKDVICGLVKGEIRIDHSTALELDKVFNGTAMFWLNIDHGYQKDMLGLKQGEICND